MKRIFSSLSLLVLGLTAVAASPARFASSDGARGEDGPTLAVNLAQSLDLVFTTYELVDVDLGALTKRGGGPMRVSLQLGGVARELDLIPNSVRSSSYRATVTTADGLVEEPARPAATYRGTVAGEPASDVRMLVDDGLVLGYVRTSTDLVFLESASRYEEGMPFGRVVAYRDSDVRPEHRGECGSLGLAAHAESLADAAEKAAGPGGLRVVEIATEADFELFRANGSSTNAVVEGVVNQIDGIFRDELNISFAISHQHVWATANDPYTTSNPKKLLRQFKKEWNRAGGTGSGVARDVAHLFTGRDLNGTSVGHAFAGVICKDPASAYSLSQSSATATLVKTVAHQLGHNFGVTSHDDERGADDCDGDGPLMCSSPQGAGANVFSQASKDDILAHVAANGACLDSASGPEPRRRVRGDFDGDGKADLSIKGSNLWLIDLAHNGFGVWDVEVTGFGFGAAHAVASDYDGDLKDDISLKGDDGVWVINFASNGFFGSDVVFSGYGFSNAHPVPADYDGDARADLSVKTDDGFWFIDYASNGFGVWDIQLSAYGFANAHPVPADYDGDGKADLSVKTDDGFWLVDFASNGFGVWDLEFSSYGDATAHPVPADYDGDGKADLSVKTDSGEWYIDFAAGGFGPGTDSVSFRGYGSTNAHPVPADYDGDGKADLSVKTDEGFWFIDYASNGFGAWNQILEGYGTLPPAIPGA